MSYDSLFVIHGHDLGSVGVADLSPFYFLVRLLMYIYVSALNSFILIPRQCMQGFEMTPESN